MRQHITEEQSYELGELGFYEKHLTEEAENYFYHKDLCRYLTIGKMIEILNKTVVTIGIFNDYDIEIDMPCEWWNVEFNYGQNEFKFQSIELVDALFEAIKEVL